MKLLPHQAFIRLAKEEDIFPMLEIYSGMVRTTAATFEYEPPSFETFRDKVLKIQKKNPWIVLIKREEIVGKDGQTLHKEWLMGYAYAGPHRERIGYQWDVEFSAYIHEKARGMGIGRILYDTLKKIVLLQGYYNAYAVIALPNEASVRLHESVGFRTAGVHYKTGFKFGQWHDVSWWQMELRPKDLNPVPPLAINAPGLAMEVAEILAEAIPLAAV
jgi:phosphinothricin acetyltransferase